VGTVDQNWKTLLFFFVPFWYCTNFLEICDI